MKSDNNNSLRVEQTEGRLNKLYGEEARSLEALWRTKHLRVMIVLSFVTVAAEIIMSFFIQDGGIATLTAAHYYSKYVVVPACSYMAIVVLTILVTRCSDLRGRQLNYVISFAFACICLLVCFYHGYFVAVYAGGVVAIAMTTIYNDKTLTGLVTLFIIVVDVIISLTNFWDPIVNNDLTYMLDISMVIIIELSTYFIGIMIIQWEDKRRRAFMIRQFEVERLRHTATFDQLTGIRNRLGLRQYIDSTSGTMVYVMMDIDHFKMVNDQWGHDVGDSILENLGKILLANENEKTGAFRYGGDEFLMIFTDCAESEIIRICQQICADFVQSLPEEIRSAGADISYGLSPADSGLSPSRAIKLADEALYRAKKS
jgi:diguanylate cyclase (GGDEF)-like protein